MDKLLIEKTINEIIYKNYLLKCRPRWLSKPTQSDEKFLTKFFNDKNEPIDMLDEDYYENYNIGSMDAYDEHVKLQGDFHINGKGFTNTGDLNEVDSVSDWGYVGFDDFNGKIYNTEDFREKKAMGLFDDDGLEIIDKKIDLIKSAIEKSPDIPENMLLYRGGHWDKRIKVGDVVTQDGFASLTYVDDYADDFVYDDRYMIEFYVPKGSKGLWLDAPFMNLGECEYLTPPNMRYYVFDIDDGSKSAKVVILPD